MEQPLKGPLYLRSSGKGLPEVVAQLKGGGLEVLLTASLDSVRGRLRAVFNALPDVLLEKLVLEIDGGKRGFLSNRANLCKGTDRAGAFFEAQNAKTEESHPLVAVSCKTPQPKGERGTRR